MSSLRTKQIIYELDEEDNDSPKKSKRNDQKHSQILNRKLGQVSYQKWGSLYNYYFSFDLTNGRLLCYKTEQAGNPNNYYVLIGGSFIQDDEEIQKLEKLFQKKKNYQAPPDSTDISKSLIYVRTRKGKSFRLVTNESHDKIIGYLQMCFNSKINLESKCFFALLGVGIISVAKQGYKINTGILVPLDNWTQVKSPNNYLKSPDLATEPKIGQLVNNVSVIGALISAFKCSQISFVFNPASQKIDVIQFDQQKQPHQFLYQIFYLRKVRRGQNSYNQQVSNNQNRNKPLMKLQTMAVVNPEVEDYSILVEGKSVQILCKKAYRQLLSEVEDLMQEQMMKTRFIDEITGQDDEKEEEREMVAQALNFYRKALTYYPHDKQQEQDDTKEFIMVNQFQLSEEQKAEIFKDDYREKSQTSLDYSLKVDDQISDEHHQPVRPPLVIQPAKHINIQMNRNKKDSQNTPERKKSEILDSQSRRESYKNGESQFKNSEQQSPQEQENQQEQNLQQQSPQDPIIQEPIQQNQEPQKQIDQVQEVQQNEDDEEGDGDPVVQSQDKDSYPTQTIKGLKTILKYATEFNYIKRTDEFRVSCAHEKGGTTNLDKAQVNLSRAVGKQMIKDIGRKIISGNFNLSTVSFPIKAMIPKSGLEKTFMQTILFPLYINKAASINDPIERMKLVMVAAIGNYIQANTFLKPLNPIIGETFEGSYDDGTQLYAEQISHHPPVSYFLVYGPQKSYKFWGYYLYEASAGLNTLGIKNNGRRYIEFVDGQRIQFDFNQEQYSGTFMGTMKHESSGTVTFKDEKNGLVGTMVFGKVKKKPTDYIEGEIKQGAKSLSKVFGSYMGFLEWDKVRYWDARDVLPFRLKVENSQIGSDHSHRQDLNLFKEGDINGAQKAKEELEGLQRQDAKLRKEFALQSKKNDKKKK